jgi:hypothetical protein
MTPAEEMTDRQARVLIVAAEEAGFRREAHLIFWQYDESLQADAGRAREFLAANQSGALSDCASAPDPIPAWMAVKRIADERRHLNYEDVGALVDAALERGLDVPEPDLPLSEWHTKWERARLAIALLWEHDPQALPEILGDQGRIAPLPESAVTRCPSCCEEGWVTHPYAGRLRGDGDREEPSPSWR